MSVLWLKSGYTMKYSLSPWEIPWASPSGFPSGSGYISLYIPPLVTIQIQYIVFKFQFIVPEWDKSPSTKCPPLSDFSQAWISLDILYKLTVHRWHVQMCSPGPAHTVQHNLCFTCLLHFTPLFLLKGNSAQSTLIPWSGINQVQSKVKVN